MLSMVTELAQQVALGSDAVWRAVTYMSLLTGTPHCYLVYLHTAGDLLFFAVLQGDVVELALAAHMRV